MASPRLAETDLEHVLEHVGDDWQQLRGSHLFLTGGSGFFGAWLLESLLWANERHQLGVRATVLTRNPFAFETRLPHLTRNSVVTLLPGSLTDFAAPQADFTHVIHAAVDSAASPGKEAKLRLVDSLVSGTRRVLEFANHARLQGFLYTSSGAVYGPQPSALAALDESYPAAHDPGAPSATYGLGKRLAEHLCQIYASAEGLPLRIARPFAFVGPHLPLNEHFAIGNFIRDALAGETIRVQGDGTPLRSFLYAADLAIWLWRILFRGKIGIAYNVGSEIAISIAETARLVASATVPSPAISIQAKPRDDTPRLQYVPATARACRDLGLAQWIDLPDAIARTLSWHQQRIAG